MKVSPPRVMAVTNKATLAKTVPGAGKPNHKKKTNKPTWANIVTQFPMRKQVEIVHTTVSLHRGKPNRKD